MVHRTTVITTASSHSTVRTHPRATATATYTATSETAKKKEKWWILPRKPIMLDRFRAITIDASVLPTGGMFRGHLTVPIELMSIEVRQIVIVPIVVHRIVH